jgi:hypothetical protein
MREGSVSTTARMNGIPAALLVPLSGVMAVVGALSVMLGIWAAWERCY